MCGITGIVKIKQSINNVSTTNTTNITNTTICDVFSDLYESLFHLQHRGQDSVGVCAFTKTQTPLLIKREGLINELKNEFNSCTNITCALGHIRYSTNNGQNIHGKEYNKLLQIQPIYKPYESQTSYESCEMSTNTNTNTNTMRKFNIYMCHNGHIDVNDELLNYCKSNGISIDYNSDSDILYNIFLN